ncbi:FtsK/SpoIIIE domain-containing protein [Saccharopolyspora sp. NPDC050389]|uniref:FtsK/SpoIIIE domain-containing protein n=1 Tax=Saccharopolyspora sp. NPDC050389 TaxID=3155516 RepID=UPI0033F4B300
MTIRDPETSASQDVEVIADPGSSVGSILSSLPTASDRACFVGAAQLDPLATFAQSPLLHGAVISIGAPGPVFRPIPTGTGDDSVGVLRVGNGPDAGLAVPLAPGEHVVARRSSAAVCLRDFDVSRNEHARLEVSRDGKVLVVDCGSTNGTFVGGSRVTGKVELRPRSVLRIGTDELSWTPHPGGTLRGQRSADGRVEFNRAFTRAPAIPSMEVQLPVRQAAPADNSLTALATFLPIGGAVVLAVLMSSPSLLWFGLIGLLGYWLTSAAQERQQNERTQTFAAAANAATGKINDHIAAEQKVRHQRSPGPAEIAATAAGERSDLWTRRADMANGLVLRVGVADQPASVTVRGEPWQGFQRPLLRSAPATVDLRATGVFGVVGSGERARALLRWLVIQLATLRAPDDLRLVMITAGQDRSLTWARWLPHLDAGAEAPCRIGNTRDTRAARVQELRTLIAARKAERRSASGGWSGDEVVVVLDGALALRDLPGMNEILRDGPSVGVYALCADRQGMNECYGMCEVDTKPPRLTRSRDDRALKVEPDGLDEETATRLARALAPMRDRLTLATAQNAIPGTVRFLDLLGISTPTAAEVLAEWGESRGPRTRVVLGADANGPVSVDLAVQGPHTMLGGATGAGKSILLQTLVTSLLLTNRPDELNLVLVDFKGGSAFLPFRHCPHVTALIRSTGETVAEVFDEAAAARTLSSIRAEVSRRESLLARYEGEIDKYWQRARTSPDLPPLPRLVMIFDEFARVLDSSQDFIKELVGVAAKGRSLGMHLVLATQSLQGKLSPELKNNISLRISLRQNEPADSTEVLGVPDAAELPGALRGRGLIVCTTAESRIPLPFQSGYLGAPPSSGLAPARLRALTWTDLGVAREAEPAGHSDTPTDQ